MSNPDQKADLSVNFTAAGDSDWYQNVLSPLARELEAAIPRHIGNIPPPLRHRMTRSEPVIVNAFGMVAVVGVTLYFLHKADKLLDKVLDDGYEVILKPQVRKMFQGLEAKLTGSNRKSKKAFVVNIWYEQHNVLVTVAIVGSSFEEIVSQLDLMGHVHAGALNWITTRGVSAPVHHYALEDGKVNAEPLLFDREEEVMKRLISD